MKLTKRGQEVAALIMEGLTRRQIADKLFLSPYTVQAHVRRIHDDLGIPTHEKTRPFLLYRRVKELEVLLKEAAAEHQAAIDDLKAKGWKSPEYVAQLFRMIERLEHPNKTANTPGREIREEFMKSVQHFDDSYTN